MVVLLVQSEVQASLFSWVGANTNFANNKNWAQPDFYTPTRSQTCKVVYGGQVVGNEPVYKSVVESDTYNVGNSFVMKTGHLVLRDGAILKFSNSVPAADSCTARWVGVNYTDTSTDIMCHRNFLVNGQPAPDAPCDRDDISFPATSTFSVRLQPSAQINVFAVEAGGLSVSQVSNWNTLGPGFAAINQSRVFLGSQAAASCGLVDPEDSRHCVCFSSCPTPAMEEAYEDVREEAAAKKAQEDIDAAKQNITKRFEGELTAASLDLTADQLNAALGTQEQRDQLIDQLEDELKELWGANNVTIQSLELTAGGVSLLIEGSVTASAAVIGADGTPLNVDATAWSSTDNSNLLVLLQSAIRAGIEGELSDDYAATQRAALVNAGATPAELDLFDKLVASFLYPTEALNTVLPLSSPCDLACVNDMVTSWNADSNLGKRLGVEDTQLRDLADTVKVACSASSCGTADDYIQAVQDENVNNAPTAQPSSQAMQSAWFSFGQSLPLWKRTRLIDSTNLQNFTQYFTDPVTGRSRLLLPLGWVATGIQFRAKPASLRRRRAVDETWTLQVSLNYTTICSPGSSQCQIVEGSAVYNALIADVNNLATLFNVQAQPYYNLATSQYKWAEIISAAASRCSTFRNGGSSLALAVNQTRDWVFGIIECGNWPRMANGVCLEQDPTAFNQATTTAESVTCASTLTSDKSSGGSSSSGSLPMMAGAAGAGILILIVIIVVIYKKRSKASRTGPAANKHSDRTVVAFENPLYPAHDGHQTYDEPTFVRGGSIGEGLYAETAHNLKGNNNKENPLYESAEDLTLSNPLYDGPLDDGYLDTTGLPSKADGGYLETERTYDNDPPEHSKSGQPVYDNFEDEQVYGAKGGYLDTHPNPQGSGYQEVVGADASNPQESLYEEAVDDNNEYDDIEMGDGNGYLDVSADADRD